MSCRDPVLFALGVLVCVFFGACGLAIIGGFVVGAICVFRELF